MLRENFICRIPVRRTYTQPVPSMEKLPQIQVARAIAALMVVVYHSYMGLRSFNDEAKVDIPFISDVPIPAIIFVVAVVIAAVVLRYTRFVPT